jgi:hypothetical protein
MIVCSCFVGSLIAIFLTGSNANNLAAAVKTIANDPNAISGLPASQISINGQTYSTSLKSDSGSTLSSNWTIVIVIIVVGLVGTVLLILVMHLGFRKCAKEQDRRRLINTSNDEHIFDGDENMGKPIEGKTVDFKLTQRPTSGGILSKKTNQVNPMLQNNFDNN